LAILFPPGSVARKWSILTSGLEICIFLFFSNYREGLLGMVCDIY